MSGPWEAYQRKESEPEPGPWTAYQQGNFGGRLNAAQDAQSLAQMSHPMPAARPSDLYTEQADQQSFLQNLAAGAGGVAYGLGYLGPKSLVGKAQPGEVADWKASMTGLGNTAGGTVGQVLGYAAPAAIAAPFVGASVPLAAAVGAGEGLLLPAESMDERLLNTALTTGGAVLGQAGGNALAQRASSRLAKKSGEATQEARLNAVRDETMRRGREVGYVLPPSAAGKPSLLETLGGQIKTQQQSAWQNQKVSNVLARRALGLADDAPLTADTMRQVREVAGKEYARLGKMGRLRVEDALLPGAKAQVTRQNWFGEVGDNLPKQQYFYLEADQALESVKQLRHDGHELLNAARLTGDPAQRAEAVKMLGQASTLEDVFEQNMKAQGRLDQLDAFRKARQQIAKSYTIEDAIHSGSGDVEARLIGRAYDEGEKRMGPRLTGDMETIGRFANTFPQQSAWRSFQPLPNSALDAGTATIAAAAAAHPSALTLAAVPYTRNPVRNFILREAKQNALLNPTYRPGLLTRVMPPALNSPLAKALAQGAGVYGYGVEPHREQ